MAAFFQVRRTALILSAQICPKTNLELEIQKTNVDLRISILEILYVPMFGLNGQPWIFWPNLTKNELRVGNSEN